MPNIYIYIYKILKNKLLKQFKKYDYSKEKYKKK